MSHCSRPPRIVLLGIWLTFYQLRVTAAEPGRVDFELDIKKEHTVRLLCEPPIYAANIVLE